MVKLAREQLNFNTALLMIVGALVTVGVKKADAAFEQITKLTERQEDLQRRIGNMESFLGIYTPKSYKKGDTQ